MLFWMSLVIIWIFRILEYNEIIQIGVMNWVLGTILLYPISMLMDMYLWYKIEKIFKK